MSHGIPQYLQEVKERFLTTPLPDAALTTLAFEQLPEKVKEEDLWTWLRRPAMAIGTLLSRYGNGRIASDRSIMFTDGRRENKGSFFDVHLEPTSENDLGLAPIDIEQIWIGTRQTSPDPTLSYHHELYIPIFHDFVVDRNGELRGHSWREGEKVEAGPQTPAVIMNIARVAMADMAKEIYLIRQHESLAERVSQTIKKNFS